MPFIKGISNIQYQISNIKLKRKTPNFPLIGNLKFDICNLKLKSAFTLIELLIVISIIALLVAAATVSWRNAQEKGRDGRRKTDLKAIQQALETYLQTNGKYPTATASVVEAYNSTAGGGWIAPLVPQFINTLPVDPTNSASSYYWYCVSSSHFKYTVGAKLENVNDPDLNTSPLAECTNPGSLNYFVQSP